MAHHFIRRRQQTSVRPWEPDTQVKLMFVFVSYYAHFSETVLKKQEVMEWFLRQTTNSAQ